MPIRVQITFTPPKIAEKWMNPFSDPSKSMHALEAFAASLVSSAQARFGRMEADERGNLHPVKPLADVTLDMAEGRALKLVGEGGKIRQPTGRRKYPLAVGKGAGVQRTARVRRYRGSIPLIDTGTLRASLVGGAGHVRKKDPFHRALLIGTNIRYAYMLHEGAVIPVTEDLRTKLGVETGVWFKVGTRLRIPPRRFLLPSREEIEKATNVFLAVWRRLR